MELNPTDAVADIGAGTGYFTFCMAEQMPKGKFYAVDVQPEMLGFIRKTLGTKQDPNLLEVASTKYCSSMPIMSMSIHTR